MIMKKFFICAAVVAASIFGVMKATDVISNSNMSDVQLENVEAIANPEGLMEEGPYYPLSEPKLKVQESWNNSTSQNNSNSQTKDNKCGLEGKGGYTIGGGPEGSIGGNISRDKETSQSSNTQENGSYNVQVNMYVQGCVGSSETHCTPVYL